MMNKKIKIILWNVLVFFILCLVVEAVLWKQGYQPGMIDKSPWFKRVDTLRPLKAFTMDSAGIMKISPHAAAYTRDYIRYFGTDNELDYNDLNPDEYYIYQYSLGKDYAAIAKGDFANDFTNHINSLKGGGDLDVVDSAYLEYILSPINSEGFRSIPFKDYDTEKTKVLLLGDSFTWGHSTKNKTNSFADGLVAKGYAVFNAGITATDLPQYHAIVKKYLPRIHPDVVIANVYLGNDIAKNDRPVQADLPLFYYTNAGFLFRNHLGADLGEPDSIYQHILRLASIPDQDINWFNHIMSKTRFTTLTWGVLAKYRILGIGPWPTEYSLDYWQRVKEGWEETGYAINRHYLERMDSLCQARSTLFLVSIIPEQDNINILDEEVRRNLDGFPYYRIQGLGASHYLSNDGHFNDEGHAFYADFLDSLLQNY